MKTKTKNIRSLRKILEKKSFVQYKNKNFALSLAPYFQIQNAKTKKSVWCGLIIWAASWQNQQNGMCAQRRLRAAWDDPSLCCPHEESMGP